MTSSELSSTAPKRTVKSFVRRQGRLTGGQKAALEQLWPKYAIDLPPESKHPVHPKQWFEQTPTHITLEIGFGNGESLLQQAQDNPEHHFIGIEVYPPGVGHCLKGIDDNQLKNIKVLMQDATDLIQQQLGDESIDVVQIFFPDPWPKKKHHKRRLIQAQFVQALLRILKPCGKIHVATDWQHYAEHAMDVLQRCSELDNTATPNNNPYPYVERPANRPLTKFEQRGMRLGHGVWDMVFEKRPSILSRS